MEISLNIYYVEQANFTIIIRNRKAIIYDCGTWAEDKWKIKKKFVDEVKKYLNKIFNNIDEVLLIISLPNKYVIDRDIVYDDNFKVNIEYIESLVVKLRRCNLSNIVNDGTNKKGEQFKESEQYKKIEQSNKILKCNNNIEKFKNYSRFYSVK